MNYADTASRVFSLLAKYGTTITYTRNASTVNGSAGTVMNVATNYTGIPAVSLDASKGSTAAFANKRDDGSLKGAKLRFLKIAAKDLAIEPRADDLLTFAGQTWRVLGCSIVDVTGSNPLIYGVGVMAI